MSIPLALQLDSPPFLRNRRMLATIAVAILVSGSVAGWLLTRSGESVPQAKSSPLASASASAMVSAPHTSEGAVIASGSFLALYGEALGSDDSSSLSAFDALIDQSAAPELKSQITSVYESIHQDLAPGSSLGSQLTPVAYKIVSYTDTRDSVVSVWSVMVTTTNGIPRTYWTTSDVSLAWRNGHYRVTKWVVRPGPSPQISSTTPGADADNAASLIGVLDGYESYRLAPADSNKLPSSQGSK